MKELVKVTIANKRTNESTICDEHSVNITWTNVYNCINSENNNFEY